MRLLLIRHGQTLSNVRQLLDTGAPGAPLTGLGIEQAAALPDALAAEQIGALYASNLTRSQETAAPLARALGLSVQVREGIREISAGELEMRGDTEAVEQYVATMLAWDTGDITARLPGGESGQQAIDRFDAVVGEVAALGQGTVALVSHGAMIRAWTGARAVNLGPGFTAEHFLSNTGMVALDGDPGSGWRVRSWTGTAMGGRVLTELAGDGPAADTSAL